MSNEVVKGIGVFRYPNKTFPNGKTARDVAREIVENLKTGGVIFLPNTRDVQHGDYEWDFRVEPVGADHQVIAQHNDNCDEPTVVEGGKR